MSGIIGESEREMIDEATLGPSLDDLHRMAARRGAWIEIGGEQVIARPVIIPTVMRVHCQCGYIETVTWDCHGRDEPAGWLGHVYHCHEASAPRKELR